MADQLEAVAHAIAQWARAYPRIRRVYLYGSRIRGANKDGGPDSDLDIAIELDTEDGQEILMYWYDHSTIWRNELRALVAAIAPWPVQLEYYHSTNFRKVFAYVNECNVVVYEAGSKLP
jgi:hypothetical protein